MTRTPPPDKALTVDDIPSEDLPNGTATVLTVTNPQGIPQDTALIDDAGYVRTVGTGRYVGLKWDVRPRTDE